MSTHFSHDCPYCLTRGAGFEMRFQWRPSREDFAHLLATCGVCKNGMVIRSQTANGSTHPDLIQHDVPYPAERYQIVETWPQFSGCCPASVPANVESFYNQGLENLAGGRWDAAGAMFRKSLDVGTKLLSPQHRSETLFSRIDKMVETGTLTSAMGDWSHEVRLEGNDAVHDDEPETRQDAAITQKFAEAVLTYAFTLPAMVKMNRAKREPTEVEAEEPAEA